jgi:hypothetical protein
MSSDVEPLRSGATSNTLYIGYRASLRNQSGWLLTYQQSRPGPKGAVVRRTTWSGGTNQSRRLIIDAGEYLTSGDVEAALDLHVREAGVTYQYGPPSLGGRSQVHPDTRPWSIYVTRANLLLWGLSNGIEQLDVAPLLAPLLKELDTSLSTQIDRHLTFSRIADGKQPSGVIQLRFQPDWELGEWAWLKFVATGATLERAVNPRELLVRPISPDSPVEVTGWVIEPGRQTYMGQYSATAG